jgi:flagellin-specific chaperone FliS
MRAYEYGLKYYGGESLHDAQSNIYAFDDEVRPAEDQPEEETTTDYKEIEVNPDVPNTFRLAAGGDIINIKEQEYISTSGVTSEITLAFEDQIVYYDNVAHLQDIYKYKDTYYVRIGNVLNTVSVGDRFKIPRRPTPIQTLNSTLTQRNVTVIVFLSHNGVQLERAYQAIDELYENEIVFFIERNDDKNYFGSVTRVKSGSNINAQSNLPYDALSNVCSIFKTDVKRSHFKEMIEDHVVDKNSNLYLIQKKVLGFFTKIVIVPANFAYETLAQGMDFVSEQLDKLLLAEKRWRYYKEDGSPVDDPQLLLPGIGLIRNLQAQHKKNPATEPSKLTRQVISFIGDIESVVNTGIDTLKSFKTLQDFVKGRLSPLLSLLGEARAFLNDPVEKGLQLAEAGFVMLNAFIVGVLNSLIDTIKGIFDLISLACKAVVALNKEAAKAAASPASYASMLFEMLENVIETVQQVFTMENFKAFFAFLKKAISFILNSPPSLNIHVDAVAYYTGYIIGFIIEEVVMAILTGGAKTVAEAVKLVVQSVRKLATSMAEFGAKSVRKLRAITEVSIDALLTIFDLIREKLRNVPRILDDLWEWLKALLTKGKSLYDDVTDWLLKQYRIAQATIDLLKDLGVLIVRKIENPNARQWELVTPGGYRVLYGDKTLLEGSEEAMAAFSKRIDEIRKSAGSKGIRKHLDEVAAGTKHALGLSKKALRILDDLINDALRISADKRPGVGAVLEGNLNGANTIIKNYSGRGLTKAQRRGKMHPLVLEWLDNAPEILRKRPTHGNCAETFNISDWLFEAERKLKMKKGSMKIDQARNIFDGVVSKAKAIENNNVDRLVHGLHKSACHSCNPMLKHFNITEVF